MRGSLGAAVVLVLAAAMVVRAPSNATRAAAHTLFVDAGPESPCAVSRSYVEIAAEVDSVARDVVVVTVADPETTRLPYVFDFTVDALQLALSRQGYTLERFWLPWGHRDADGGGCAHSTAGVLFVHKDSNDGGHAADIAVMLVGESPTSGLRKQAFENALNHVEAYVVPPAVVRDGGQTGHLLGIVGPTFSASAQNLADELRLRGLRGDGGVRPLIQNQSRLLIVSGSATVPDLARVLSLPDVEFYRTVLPDSETLGALLDYLKRQGVDPRRDVALLVEANTLYGQSGRHHSVHLEVPFPLHISRIREQLLGAANTAVPSIFGVESLGLPSDKTLPALDVIPQYSQISPTLDERALETALASLARENVSYVGIIATDERDALFLATEVRSFCPNATLFTIDGSLLLTHPDFARFTTGMLNASTYPLIALNQAWTPHAGEETRIQFPAPAAEGLFNAMTYVLTRSKDELLEYGAPFANVSRRGSLGRPPV